MDNFEYDFNYLGYFNDIFNFNISMDPLNNTYHDCEQYNIKSFTKVFLPIFFSTIFIVGLLGNTLTIAVYQRNRQTLALTDILILYLSIADILLVGTLPFWAVEAVKGWIFESFACKVFGALFNINFNSGIYLLAGISIQRYLSIVHAVRMHNKPRSLLVHVSCWAVWFFCHLLAIPDFIYLKKIKMNDTWQCQYNFEAQTAKKWMVGLRFLTHIISFLIPLTIMFYSYFMIILTLRESQNMQRKKEVRAIKVIVMVVSAFLLCWVPYHVVILIDTLLRVGVIGRSCAIESTLDIAISITSCLGYFHCCLNPFLYAYAGVKFRRNLLQIFCDIGCITHKTVKKYAKSITKDSMSQCQSGETTNSGF
ncbi:C-X-C chemokine receptor type 3-like isoform X2 [Narcine bancroftii]